MAKKLVKEIEQFYVGTDGGDGSTYFHMCPDRAEFDRLCESEFEEEWVLPESGGSFKIMVYDDFTVEVIDGSDKIVY